MKPRLSGLTREFFDTFEDAWAEAFKVTETVSTSTKSDNRPTYRSRSDEEGMTLEVELPGVDPSCVKLWASKEQLCVKFVKNGKECEARYTLRGYDPSKAQPTMAHGLLTIRMKDEVEAPDGWKPIDIKR